MLDLLRRDGDTSNTLIGIILLVMLLVFWVPIFYRVCWRVPSRLWMKVCRAVVYATLMTVLFINR